MNETDKALIMVIYNLQKVIARDMHLGEHNKIAMLDSLENAVKLIRSKKIDNKNLKEKHLQSN